MRQRGAVSPFLFGMLAGVAVLSGGIKIQADLEMKRIQEQQEQRSKETADTYRRAVEGALMAETTGTFGAVDTNAINSFVAKSIGGGTRSGQNIAIGTITTDVGTNSQQIIISTSDDNLVRTQITALETAGDAAAMAADTINNRDDVITIDTSGIRTKQIAETIDRMEKYSEILYSFWGKNGRFPTLVEYPAIAAQSSTTDFWGGAFTYAITSDNIAQLQATTPWAQVLTVPMNMDNVIVMPDSCAGLGNNAQGGICLAAGVGALVSAEQDEAGTPVFSTENVITGATSLLDGAANTDTYIGLGAAKYPVAALCHNLVLNGFDDWYLPSRNELSTLYTNKATIGGFTDWELYWTSTEATDSAANTVSFGDGLIYQSGKGSLGINTRCVRKGN